jgi:hypothetical protein
MVILILRRICRLIFRQSQQEHAKEIQTRIPTLSETLAEVANAEGECLAANVEENDYTVFTSQDLEFELEQVIQGIAKKISFIDNQVCLTPKPLHITLAYNISADRLA